MSVAQRRLVFSWFSKKDLVAMLALRRYGLLAAGNEQPQGGRINASTNDYKWLAPEHEWVRNLYYYSGATCSGSLMRYHYLFIFTSSRLPLTRNLRGVYPARRGFDLPPKRNLRWATIFEGGVLCVWIAWSHDCTITFYAKFIILRLVITIKYYQPWTAI